MGRNQIVLSPFYGTITIEDASLVDNLKGFGYQGSIISLVEKGKKMAGIERRMSSKIISLYLRMPSIDIGYCKPSGLPLVRVGVGVPK